MNDTIVRIIGAALIIACFILALILVRWKVRQDQTTPIRFFKVTIMIDGREYHTTFKARVSKRDEGDIREVLKQGKVLKRESGYTQLILDSGELFSYSDSVPVIYKLEEVEEGEKL